MKLSSHIPIPLGLETIQTELALQSDTIHQENLGYPIGLSRFSIQKTTLNYCFYKEKEKRASSAAGGAYSLLRGSFPYELYGANYTITRKLER